MVIVKLKDQLGNQMFAYASVKAMAEKKGYSFGFYRIPLDEKYINNTDKKYGSDLSTIFHLPEQEWQRDMPKQYFEYKEQPMAIRRKGDYPQRVFSELMDNCVADGHFISVKYFEDCFDKVRTWFNIPEDILRVSQQNVNKCSINGKRKICSVHFRVGHDYAKLGYRLSHKYWEAAAENVLKKYNDVQFVCLYDKKTEAVSRFIKKYNALEQHGSLIEDMAFISLCDVCIVSNSTFSIMSAILNKKAEYIVRPQKYPTQVGYMPDDVFPDSWIALGNGKRDVFSACCYRICVVIRGIKEVLGV